MINRHQSDGLYVLSYTGLVVRFEQSNRNKATTTFRTYIHKPKEVENLYRKDNDTNSAKRYIPRQLLQTDCTSVGSLRVTELASK